jgi:hypothetical protein
VPSGSATNLAGGAAGKVVYQTGSGTTDFTAVGTTGDILKSNATGAPTWLTTLPVANGGTGQATLTANNVILGNGTSAVQEIAPSTSGNVLTSNGSTWVSSALVTGAQDYILQFNGIDTPPTMGTSGFGII